MTAPERILAWKSDGDGSYHGPLEGDVEPIEFMTTEYTRTDIHQAALDRIAELEGALKDLADASEDGYGDNFVDGEQYDTFKGAASRARAVLAKGDG